MYFKTSTFLHVLHQKRGFKIISKFEIAGIFTEELQVVLNTPIMLSLLCTSFRNYESNFNSIFFVNMCIISVALQDTYD